MKNANQPYDEVPIKDIIKYCEDIINKNYYNLNTLINLNIVKAVYDDNNNVKWYITNSEQEYTTYKNLRRGLSDYVMQFHYGEFWKEEVAIKRLGEFIERRTPSMILTNKPSIQITLKLVYNILEIIKSTKLTGTFKSKSDYNECLQKNKWDALEERIEILFGSLLSINEIKFESLTDNKLIEEIINNRKVKNVIIDALPETFNMTELKEWSNKLKINVFFTDINLNISSFHSNKFNFNNNPFLENRICTDWGSRIIDKSSDNFIHREKSLDTTPIYRDESFIIHFDSDQDIIKGDTN